MNAPDPLGPLALHRFAFVGFGEAGGILGGALAQAGCDVVTYDLLLDDPGQGPAMRARATAAGVRAAASLVEAVTGADCVVSAVTAASAEAVARQAGACLRPGQVFLDINSVAPGTKQQDEAWVVASGASYVEAAVMAPVPPYGLRVPMLLGGREAAAVAQALGGLGMQARFASETVGVASAVKMCRSVMIKGLEALTVECLTAARHYGAEDAVLASLAETFPSMGWQAELPDYLVSRVAEHGTRRAAEMEEVADTLRAAAVAPHMTQACVQVQRDLPRAMAAAGLAYPREASFSWRWLADALAQGGPRRP